MTDPETGNTIVSIGHNQPPSVAALREALLTEQDQALAARAARRDEFVAAAGKAVIRDRQDVADASDIIHLARRVHDEIDTEARARRAPVREIADALKARVDAFWHPVSQAHGDLQRRIDAWLSQERQRIDAQRAEQDAILGIDAAKSPAVAQGSGGKAATSPSLAPRARPIRGDYGGQVTRRADIDIRVTDVRAVPDFILNAPVVTEAIISVVRSMARAGADIPGVTVAAVDRTVIL